jgi:glycosyltransferase involved in cell wall biosynthesis
MPSSAILRFLEGIGPLNAGVRRLDRRYFAPLEFAPKKQGRLGEIKRLIARGIGAEPNALAHEANEWLMRTMVRETRRRNVRAVHAYEDCSLWQFQEARRLGKACIYDMPIGYYPAWQRIKADLERRYADWMSADEFVLPVRAAQKREEMVLADLVLAPSRFVADSIREYHPHKTIRVVPYGVDLASWTWTEGGEPRDTLTYLFVGQCSVRKGTPLLLEAWRRAGLKRARLRLVGPWQLAEKKKRDLPPRCTWTAPVSSTELRTIYQAADVFVFPTNFEGRALVVIEAMASGLPVVTTEASGADDAVGEAGRVIPVDDLDALVETLLWFDMHRNDLPALSKVARLRAEACTWEGYREAITTVVRPYS